MKQKDDNFCLDRVFKEKTDYVGYTFDVYRKIYDLPLISYAGEVSEELFEYVLKRRYFVLLAVYDQEGKIYLERNIQERLYWSLPGGSILKNEDIHSAVRRVSRDIAEGNGDEIALGELEPIAFVENEFSHNGKTYKHYGIAFAARLRNKEAIDWTTTQGRFVQLNNDELENINRYANREVAKICNEYIHKFRTQPPEEEIAINEKYKFRYLIHNAIVKRFILTSRLKKKKKLLELIGSFIEHGNSVVDVSCGDSTILRDLYDGKSLDYVVANDISWSQINTKQSDRRRVLFTNHNAAYLPFKDESFDVAFCANTLHHIPSREELRGLLEGCLRIAKRAVFVEIENPKNTGWFPYLLNRYWYIGFLKDVGGSYFSKFAFESIMSDFYKDKAQVEFCEFRNIQGRYLVATVTKTSVAKKSTRKIEVEKKYFLDNKTSLVNKIAVGGFKLSVSRTERDQYFTDAGGQFVRDRTCLRIRTSEGDSELTFKGRSQVMSGSYAKVEHNMQIRLEQVDDLKEILRSIGYYRYVDLSKTRTTFSRYVNGVEQNISIDELQGAGKFVELEILADYNQWHNREDVLWEMLNQLKLEVGSDGLKEASIPYRDYAAGYLADNAMNRDKVKVFLFDFDGTLAHTESIFYKAYRDVAQQIGGVKIVPEEYARYELEESDQLFSHLGLDKLMNKTEFMKLVYDKYRGSLLYLASKGDGLASLEGVRRIRQLGYRTAMVTSSRREFVSLLIPSSIQDELFDCVVCREDTGSTKPSPEPYLECMSQLGITPNAGIAVEDSARGERSARAAGMSCVLVKGDPMFWNCNLTVDGYVFDDLMEIALILENNEPLGKKVLAGEKLSAE